jgi:hypothetical protein
METEETEETAQGAAQKTKTVTVQVSVKWVNFDIEVEASSEENAFDLALQAYQEKGVKAFSIRAGGDEVSDLDDIFHAGRRFWKVEDENGNVGEHCFTHLYDEDEDEEEEG